MIKVQLLQTWTPLAYLCFTITRDIGDLWIADSNQLLRFICSASMCQCCSHKTKWHFPKYRARAEIDSSLLYVLSFDKHCRQLVSHFQAQHPVLTNTDKIVYQSGRPVTIICTKCFSGGRHYMMNAGQKAKHVPVIPASLNSVSMFHRNCWQSIKSHLLRETPNNDDRIHLLCLDNEMLKRCYPILSKVG